MNASAQRYFAARTLKYIDECRAVQEQLHQVLTQISGFALVLLTKRSGSSLAAGSLQLVDERMKIAREQFRAIRPASDAAHHFHHLSEAVAAIDRSIGIAYRCLRTIGDARDRDDLTFALREALDHLKATARLLPGFQMVDLRQACCAVHSGPMQAEPIFAAV
jgi:hypothetical protein